MEIISLLVKTRRGEVVNQTYLIDIDDIAAPLKPAAAGLDTEFTLREGKKGPFFTQNTGNFIETYVVDQTLAQIAVLAGSIFTSPVVTYKGRAITGTPTWGWNAKFISGVVKPHVSGSVFNYQEDSDSDLVEYVVSQTPAQILAQITTNSLSDSWEINGNSEGVERYIGTNDAFDFPVRVAGVETFRFLQDGTIQYPLGAAAGYVLTSDATGIATWEPGPGAPTVELDPVISQTNNPPGAPTLGDRYLVGTVPTGAWVGNANSIAEWDGAVWQYTVPVADNVVYITNTLTTKRFNGTAWVAYAGTAILQNGNTLGTWMIIGTKDNKDFYFITNNAVRGRFSAAGNLNLTQKLFIGSGTTLPTASAHIRGADASAGTYSIKIEDNAALPLFNVENNGFTGIGILSAAVKLHVKGSSGFRLEGDDAGYSSLRIVPYSSGNTYTSFLFPDSEEIRVGGGFGANAARFRFMGSTAIARVSINKDSPQATLDIRGESNASTNYSIEVNNLGGTNIFRVKDNGTIAMLSLQTGNAGLASGDLYVDTAANILANADLIVARKV